MNILVQNNKIDKKTIFTSKEGSDYLEFIKELSKMIFGNDKTCNLHKASILSFMIGEHYSTAFWTYGNRKSLLEQNSNAVYASYNQIHKFCGGSNSTIAKNLKSLKQLKLIKPLQGKFNETYRESETKVCENFYRDFRGNGYGGRWLITDKAMELFNLNFGEYGIDVLKNYWKVGMPYRYYGVRYTLGDDYTSRTCIELLDYLRKNPKTSKREIMRDLNKGFDTITNSLSTLRKYRIISGLKVNEDVLSSKVDSRINEINKLDNIERKSILNNQKNRKFQFLRTAQETAMFLTKKFAKFRSYHFRNKNTEEAKEFWSRYDKNRGFIIPFFQWIQDDFCNGEEVSTCLIQMVEKYITDCWYKLLRESSDIYNQRKLENPNGDTESWKASFDELLSDMNIESAKRRYHDASEEDKGYLYAEYWVTTVATYFIKFTNFYSDANSMGMTTMKEVGFPCNKLRAWLNHNKKGKEIVLPWTLQKFMR